MPLSISPTQDDIFELLASFITQATGIEAIKGQVNRTPEPSSADFAVMWPLRMPRLATNIDSYVDCAFTASISGNTMTVTAKDPNFAGQIAIGSTIFGVGLATPTVVTVLGTGRGGTGTYSVSPSQSIGSETMASGQGQLLQKAECVVQVDVHGGAEAGDNAQIISTAFRDDYAMEFFSGMNANIAPLYADDPRQMPFIDAEQQYEDRWIVEVHMQVNQTVIVPQDFATAVEVDIVSVDAAYPP